MKRLGSALVMILFAAVSGCGANQANPMPDVTGDRLDVAKKDIRAAGIEQDVKVDGGGMFGVIDDSNWTVCSQSPAAGEPVSGAPEFKVDRSCGDTATASPSDTTSPSPSQGGTGSTHEPTSTGSESPIPDVITAKNTPEFAKLLRVGDYCDGSVRRFAEHHQGDTIQFNGSVVNVGAHGSYTTRFDYLLGPGDKGPKTVLGPAFKYENVNYYDFKLTGKKQPDSINIGDKFRFTATVDHFNATQCLLFLTPEKTQAR